MLQRITIHNLALICDLEIEFTQQLNIFSGETGAGKSIIVDSLTLLVGGRYDKSFLKFGEDSGYVEGVFGFNNPEPPESMGIECEDGILIVTRKFYKDGKNEIRVNGKQVTTSMLRELMQNYVDIYGQNEYQSLLKTIEQRKILDYYVFKTDGNAPAAVRDLYNRYKDILKQISSLGDEQARAQRIDILTYQIEEIKSANVKEDEEEKLIERRHVLMASERIKNALAECLECLEGEEERSALSDATRTLASISSFNESYSSLAERLRSAAIEVDDIAESVKDELDGMDGSERELDEVAARLDKIRSLKSKYGNYGAMQKFLSDAQLELERASNGAELYEELCKQESKLKKELYTACAELSELRKKGAKRLSESIVAELADLGMPKSVFEVVFAPQPDFENFVSKTTASGFDEFEFYLSPNAGQPLLPLAKIISGGEMSRFMLAIKLITGNLSGIETMIFDEIDTGISGAVGLCVAKKLAELSRGHQVLCVTHLPQIAAMADGHYFIEKSEDNGNTATRVTALDEAGMISEVARLSGTKGISLTSDKNAAELKDWSNHYKADISA